MHVSVGRTTTPRVVFLKCGQKLQKLPSLSFWTRRVGSTWVQTRGVQVVTSIKASLPCDGLRLRPPGGGCCVLKKSTMYHARLKPTACGKDIELKLAGLHSNLTEGAPSQLHESVQFDAHEAHPTQGHHVQSLAIAAKPLFGSAEPEQQQDVSLNAVHTLPRNQSIHTKRCMQMGMTRE